MCRVLSYLGKPIGLGELLYKPDNSFIKQSYHPKYMTHLLNLAGFGVVAWDKASHNPVQPFIYKTPNLPFYDENLRQLSSKIMPNCFLAHLRGVPYVDRQVVSMQNVHPFIFSDTNIALAHNGALFEFEKMKFTLAKYVDEKYLQLIHGTTDSEWIYALFLTQLHKLSATVNAEVVAAAILDTLKTLKEVRYKCQSTLNSPINLFITNGEFIAATRFVFDYGWMPEDTALATHFTYHSLWYTYGESYGLYNNEYQMCGGKHKSSIIIASEPLTEDVTTWISVPEYTLLVANLVQDKIEIVSKDIDL